MCAARKAVGAVGFHKSGEPLLTSFFLDVGIGFWENWEMKTLDNEDDDYDLIDQTEHFGVKNATISAIVCRADQNQNSQILISFENGKTLSLHYENLEDEKVVLKLI